MRCPPPQVLERESMKLDAGPNTPLPSDDGLQQLHADALAMMDELAQAGTYASTCLG